MSSPLPSFYLLFKLERQTLAVSVNRIVQMSRAVPGAGTPSAPPLLESVADFRGQMVPVLDVRLRFGLPPGPVALSDQLVFVNLRGKVAALRVDSVTGLIQINESDIKRTDEVLPGLAYVFGTARAAEDIVLIDDLDTFMSGAEPDRLCDYNTNPATGVAFGPSRQSEFRAAIERFLIGAGNLDSVA